MLYLGIDQHARQLTISLRDESGDVLQARQVSTRPEKVQAFFAKLTRFLRAVTILPGARLLHKRCTGRIVMTAKKTAPRQAASRQSCCYTNSTTSAN